MLRNLVSLVCLLGLTVCVSAVLADKPLDEDQLKWKRLGDITDARNFYLQGENAYNHGYIENAIIFWMQAIELKPDSDYTKQMLVKARAALVVKFTKESTRLEKNSDFLSEYIMLDPVIKLDSNDPILLQRLDKIKSQLTDDGNKAKVAYDEAIAAFMKSDYPGSYKSIKMAQSYGRGSECVESAFQTIEKAYNDHRYTVELLQSDLYRTSEVAFENYYWRNEGTQMITVPVDYGTGAEFVVTRWSLHGQLRNITIHNIQNVKIKCSLINISSGKEMGTAEGIILSMNPAQIVDVDFGKKSGTITLLTTASMTQHIKDITVTTTAQKKISVSGLEPIYGYASVNDKEDISNVYKLVAKSIECEMAGTGAVIEQHKEKAKIHDNYKDAE